MQEFTGEDIDNMVKVTPKKRRQKPLSKEERLAREKERTQEVEELFRSPQNFEKERALVLAEKARLQAEDLTPKDMERLRRL